MGVLIEENEDFSASPTGGAPKLDKLTKQCDVFLNRILDTIDELPYGFRLICKHIYDFINIRFAVLPHFLINFFIPPPPFIFCLPLLSNSFLKLAGRQEAAR